MITNQPTNNANYIDILMASGSIFHKISVEDIYICILFFMVYLTTLLVDQTIIAYDDEDD
jgi:hypothetical protein